MKISHRRSTETNSRLNKDVLERLDFSCLEWKLNGVDISATLRDVLRLL
jgi:hypothetical protein